MELSSSTATVHARLVAHAIPSQVYFEYGVKGDFTSRTPTQSLDASGEIIAALTELTPGATYYYRLVWVTSRGVQYGPEQVFTTTPGVRAVDDVFSAFGRKTFVLPVLANDASDMPSRLVIVSAAQGNFGQVTISQGKKLKYIPRADFAGEDSFSYSVKSASGEISTASVLVRGLASIGGTYAGLVKVNGHDELAGRVKITCTRSGSFTGRLEWCEHAYSVRGSFGESGTHVAVFRSHGQPPLHLSLTPEPQTGAVTATIEFGAEIAEGVLERVLMGKEASALKGRYTMRLEPAVEDGEPVSAGPAPQARGYGTMVISGAGNAVISATLGDGSRLSVGAAVTRQGEIPIYRHLYGKRPETRGSIHGRPKFSVIDQSGHFAGGLYWRKPVGIAGEYYPSGFETHLTLGGFPYRIKPSAKPMSGMPGQALFTLTSPSDTTPIEKLLYLSAPHRMMVLEPGSDRLKLKLDPATGRLRGTFYDVMTKKVYSLEGVVFQDENTAIGLSLYPGAVLPFTLRLLPASSASP